MKHFPTITFFFIFFFLWSCWGEFLSTFCQANSPSPQDGETQWNEWFEEKIGPKSQTPIIQKRKIQKSGRFQLAGPTAGILYRQDFYEHWNISLAGRYFFKEVLGIEFFRVTKTVNVPTEVKRQVTAHTGYSPLVQLSQFQFSSGLLWAPIYGKYAWGTQHIIHFDLYLISGLGLRFAEKTAYSQPEKQMFFEIGLGTQQHWNRTFGLLIEGRFRTYAEKRPTPTTVFDVSLQAGPSFLF